MLKSFGLSHGQRHKVNAGRVVRGKASALLGSARRFFAQSQLASCAILAPIWCIVGEGRDERHRASRRKDRHEAGNKD